jgi:hypothetical protein
VDCPEPSVACDLGSASVAQGSATTITLTFDASATDVQEIVLVHSNDPDDPVLPVSVFAALGGTVDPLEAAPDFTGATVTRDYAAGTFTDGTVHLDDYVVADQVVHFAIFGSWSPDCLPEIAAMAGDVAPDLPGGAFFFLVDQGDPAATVRHVLEKTRIPTTVFLDEDETVGVYLYAQPGVGLPFSRYYVIDIDGYVMYVSASYDPWAALAAVEAAL